jgi:hypothetical protein
MIVLDSGHKYDLMRFDSPGWVRLTFMKRMGDKYPGNTSAYGGTNFQEVFRACIDRLLHVDEQRSHPFNKAMIYMLRTCIALLEIRAAENHGRMFTQSHSIYIEHEEFCLKCGHIGCMGTCRNGAGT